MKKKVLEKVEELSDKNLELVSGFIDNLTKKKNLLPVFEEKLKTIKNNPIQEPKIAEKQKQIEKLASKGKIEPTEVLLEIVESVYSIEELEELEKEHKLELQDFVYFGGALSDKVFSKKEIVDGVEVFKEIESQNDLKPVSYSKKREIRKQFSKYEQATKKAKETVDKGERDEAKLIELQEEIKRQEKLLNIKIQEGHNLDTSNMSSWEKELLNQKVVANSFGSYTPPLGKK